MTRMSEELCLVNSMKKRTACLLASAIATSLLTTTPQAQACGGCFVTDTENTVVTGHRMALSLSPTQSVLWDQIQYAGDPAEFSWVLPVKAGATLSVGNNAFFEVLEAGTSVAVGNPPEGCRGPQSGFGCGAMASDLSATAEGGRGGDPVTVLSQSTVGPYETVTLQAEDSDALNQWLIEHGYTVPESIQPVIDSYVKEKFNFIALRLIPGVGVDRMQPVRVTQPGASYSLPLRMVAAGVGSQVDLVLFVIGEGRYEAEGFDNKRVPQDLITWNFKTDRSDYAELRSAALAAGDGRNWLTSYAMKGSLLGSRFDPLSFQTLRYASGNSTSTFEDPTTLADAYAVQAGADNSACRDAFASYANSKSLVVQPCDAAGENCAALEAGQIDANLFRCGDESDDIAVALTGLHPADVTITRLEASLPAAALNSDLKLVAANDQSDVENRIVAGLSVQNCWDDDSSAIAAMGRGKPGRRPPLLPGQMVALCIGAAGILMLARRQTQHSSAS